MKLIRACGNLIVVDEETTIVQLAHYTIQQHLLEKPLSLESQSHFSLKQASIPVGEARISNVCFSDFETQIVRQDSTVPTTKSMNLLER